MQSLLDTLQSASGVIALAALVIAPPLYAIIRKLGKKAGAALNPSTPETVLDYVLDDVDLILAMTDEQRRINRLTSSFRSKVEHVFRIVKRQFGYTRTRYRGLYKNSQQIFCLLALANIYIMREKLPQPAG